MLLSGLSLVPQPFRLIEGPALVLFVAKENSFASSCFQTGSGAVGSIG